MNFGDMGRIWVLAYMGCGIWGDMGESHVRLVIEV